MNAEEMALNIVLGALGNGLYDALTRAWAHISAAPQTAASVAEKVRRHGSVAALLQVAAAQFARELPGEATADRLRMLLVAPETDTVMRQLFAAQIATGGSEQIPDLRQQFQLLFALHL